MSVPIAFAHAYAAGADSASSHSHETSKKIAANVPENRQITDQHTPCPLCGATESVDYLTACDFTVSGQMFPIRRCTHCQMVWTTCLPRPEDMPAFYASAKYISHTDARRGAMNILYHVARFFMLKRKAHLVETHTQGKRRTLLDVGCGTGSFARHMQRRGWQVQTVEPATKAATKAATKLGYMPHHSLQKVEVAPFTAITLWHVLEHLPKLRHTFKRLNELLAPEGTLFIAVPNHPSPNAKHYGKFWAAYDVPRHLWHFSPQTMHRLAKAHGFEIVLTKAMPLDAYYISMLSEKYKGSHAPMLSGLWQGAKTHLATLCHQHKSASLIYVLKKTSTKTTP